VLSKFHAGGYLNSNSCLELVSRYVPYERLNLQPNLHA